MDKNDICGFVGSVVRSESGRDRKRYFLVVGTAGTDQDPRLLICDGTLRRASSPKEKNPAHVSVVGRISDGMTGEYGELDDAFIRKVIALYDPRLKTCGSGREDNFNAEG